MASLRILIAEDDKLSATLLKALLEAEGHVVCAVATSGLQAVEASRELVPDAVIMDIYLSDEMSGVEAARTIVQELTIPTMFITGTTDRALLEQVVESGALGLIKKPVSADELRVNLRILLHHQSMSHRLREQASRFRALFQHAPVAMFVSDAGGALLECNGALATLLGYASVAELLDRVLGADDLYAAAEHRSMLLRCSLDESGGGGGRATLRCKDGSLLDVMEYFSCAGDVECGGVRYQSVLIPLAEPCSRTVSELEVLRKTIDAIPDLVTIMGMDRSILAANRAFFRHAAKEGSDEIDPARFPFASAGAPCSGECPYSRFLQDHKEHSGWVRLVPGGPEYYNTVSPLKASDGTLLGCVQVFRLMPSPAR